MARPAPTLRAESALSRSMATGLGLGGFLVVVVVGVFLYVRALSGPPPGPDTGVAAAPASFTDADLGVRLLAPPGWSVAQPHAEGGSTETAAATTHVVFADPLSGARMTVSVERDWTGGTPSRDWVERAAPGMRSIDGRWPTAAHIGGAPALIVWSDESPEAPARYAAFAAAGGRLYRVSYSATDGGAALDDFARALVSLEWSPDDTDDIVPPLPTPRGVLYPRANTSGG